MIREVARRLTADRRAAQGAGVADSPVPTRSGPLPVTVTVSIGLTAGSVDLTTLLASADAALYNAKRSGRNRVSGP
jgi:PleD family two-component response regulator